MAKSPQRFVALGAMLLIAIPAGVFAAIGWALANEAFENQDPSEPDEWFFAGVGVGFLATLAAIVGLAVGVRWLTALAVVAQAGAVVSLLYLWGSTDYRIGDDDTDFVAVLVAVLVVDLVAATAVLVPSRDGGQARGRAMALGPVRAYGILAMAAVIVLTIPFVLLGVVGPTSGDDVYSLVGAVGLAGSLVALFGLAARSRGLVLGTVLVQAVFATMMLLAVGLFSESATGYLAVVLIADGLALWAALQRERSTTQA